MQRTELPSNADFELLRQLVAATTPGGEYMAAETDEEKQRMRNLSEFGLVELRDFALLETSCRPTMKGCDLVADTDARIALEEAERKAQFRHDFRVAAFGTVAGGVLGLFSGGLGGWLFTQAIPATLKSLGI